MIAGSRLTLLNIRQRAPLWPPHHSHQPWDPISPPFITPPRSHDTSFFTRHRSVWRCINQSQYNATHTKKVKTTYRRLLRASFPISNSFKTLTDPISSRDTPPFSWLLVYSHFVVIDLTSLFAVPWRLAYGTLSCRRWSFCAVLWRHLRPYLLHLVLWFTRKTDCLDQSVVKGDTSSTRRL